MKSRALFFFFFFICLGTQAADQSTLDSLQSELQQAGADSTKIKLLYKLSSGYRKTDLSKSEDYARQMLQLARMSNNRKGIALAHALFGKVKIYQSKPGDAIRYYKNALGMLAEIDEPKTTLKVLGNLGELYKQRGVYDEALDVFMQILTLAKEIGNQEYEARAYRWHGDIYRYLGEYSTSIGYYLKGVALAEKLDDKELLSGMLNNMGVAYNNQGNDAEALRIFEWNLRIVEELGDSSKMVLIISNIGSDCYDKGDKKGAWKQFTRAMDIIEAMGEERVGYKYVAGMNDQMSVLAYDDGLYEEALEYSQKGLSLRMGAGATKGVLNTYGNIARIYLAMGNIPDAEGYEKRKLELAEEIGYKGGIMESYWGLSRIEEQKGNYKEAFNFQNKYIELRDELLNEENNEQIAEMSAKYENDKKEKEITLLNKEGELKDMALAQKKTMLYGALGALALVLALAFVSLRGYRMKRKANLLLEVKNEEITTQKDVIEEKNKDITDSIVYAKRIQEAILPVDTEMKKVFPDSFVFSKPRDIVSGDFYWFNETNDQAVVAVVDCTGHGVPGAFMSMIGHDLLNNIVLDEGETNPATILRLMDHRVANALNKEGSSEAHHDGMDIALCSFDLKNNKVKYSGAFRPLLQLRDGEVIEHKGNKFSIGGMLESNCKLFYSTELELQKGDCLYMYSDGYPDQFGGTNGKKFMNKQFKKLLQEMCKNPMSDQGNELSDNFEEWKGNLEQVDDVCVMGIRV